MTPSLHIAGIGASAGGLEAMLPMFAKMRATGRIAYVVAQHMAKDGHDALVVRLIARESALPVVLAQDGIKLLADTVYVIPSGKDGVSGCRAIKAAGGLTLAQMLDEAKFNGITSIMALTAAVTSASMRSLRALLSSVSTWPRATANCRVAVASESVTAITPAKSAPDFNAFSVSAKASSVAARAAAKALARSGGKGSSLPRAPLVGPRSAEIFEEAVNASVASCCADRPN
jgi:hypothetical protein